MKTLCRIEVNEYTTLVECGVMMTSEKSTPITMALLLCRKRAVSDKLVEFKPLGGKSNIHDRDSQHWHLGQNKCPLRMKPKTRIRQNVKWIVVIIETIRVGVVHTHGIHGIHPHCSPHPSFPCEKLHKLQFLERAGRFSVAAYWMGNHGKKSPNTALDILYNSCIVCPPGTVGSWWRTPPESPSRQST